MPGYASRWCIGTIPTRKTGPDHSGTSCTDSCRTKACRADRLLYSSWINDEEYVVNPAGSPHQIQGSSDQISTTDDASEGVGRGKVGGRTCEVNESSKILMLGKAFEAVAPLVLTAATIAACTSWFLTARSKNPSPAPPHSGRDILEKTFFATAMLGLSGMMLELEQAPSRLVKKVSQTLFAIAPIVPPATFAGLTINRLLLGSCAPHGSLRMTPPRE